MPSDTPTLDFAAHWLLFVAFAAAAVVFVRRARRDPTRARLVLGNGLVLVALLAGLLACGETYLRYVFDQSTWHAEALTTRAWLRRHCSLNRDGFREVEFTRDRVPGTQRVVMLGDSFTFGYGIADPADRATGRLQAALDRDRPGRYEIWNAGAIGADTAAELGILRHLLGAVAVDRVVLAYSPNDVEGLLPLARHQIAPFEAAEPGSLRSRSYLLDHLVMRFSLLDTSRSDRFFAGLDAIHADAARFAPQAQRIADFARLCQDTGTRLDVVVWPLISHWGPDYPFDAWHDRIADAWRAAGVDVIDLRETFAGLTYEDLRVSSLDAHPNERANTMLADLLLERLFPE